jgi:hypothetical protein
MHRPYLTGPQFSSLFFSKKMKSKFRIQLNCSANNSINKDNFAIDLAFCPD